MVFLIESSNLVSDQDFDNAKDFVRSVVASLDIALNHTRVGVAITEVGAYRRLSLNEFSDKGFLMNAIDLIERTADVSNSLGSAMAYVRNSMFSLQSGARTYIPDIIYIITPGTISLDDIESEIGETRDQETFVGMVVYGSDKDILEKASGLVSPPSTNSLIHATDSGVLSSVVQQTVQGLCSEIPGENRQTLI